MFAVLSLETLKFAAASCTYLHARWAINALLACVQKHGISPVDFRDYYSFFDYLTVDCVKDDHAHISWECTTNKKTMCQDITNRWLKYVDELSVFVEVAGDDGITVLMEHFESVLFKMKSGEEKKRLKQISTDANLAFIITFLADQLPKIIH